MTDSITLALEKREITGNKVKHLRRKDIIPANIFGKNIDSLAVKIDNSTFQNIYKVAGETSVIHATIGKTKKTRPLIISDIQYHPVTGEVLHVDFQQVDLTQKITASVPVEIIGTSEAVKEKGGILFTIMSELEVEALPTDLPESIEVDIATLKNYGDTISVADLPKSEKYEYVAEPDAAIVQVQEPREEELDEDESAEFAEAQIIGEEVGVEETSEVTQEESKPEAQE